MTSLGKTRERILVLCRAIPEDSQKYGHTVCVAGLTDKAEFRRLYPVPFMPFRRGGAIPFHKKEWMEADLSSPDDARDKRPESRKIDMRGVRVLRKASDEEVRNRILRVLSPSIGAIEASGASLGFIRPKLDDFDIRMLDKSTKDEQLHLNGNGSLREGSKIKLGQVSRYIFVCEDPSTCTCRQSPHYMQIRDWEVNELYRHVIERTSDDAEIASKMRYKWFDWMKAERDLYFMMGTHHRWKNWMIVSVLYLRKTDS